ncbi:putative transcription factor Hap3/NF-YB family [Medicago truncatula]|uniref:Putative transcription factor Hap3/NF-YB family n=1 Tax=Medicago truncatula TaxID=3880 RepID=I3SWQ9_MEDTR|nr:transcription initiation factor TFIID subunit 11 [Medicago truncatula]AFK44701.1 unknown [Medicago truncatula]KEH41247.1 transcription initiation factor TFIID, subunit TAF11 [Medicago truncatula]RHN78781.1 putative transcription factor Hap3/NF-YB family [Medicago truncatula]
MKQSKDPFEAAFEESPPESPIETEPDPDASTENPNSTNSSLPQSTLTHEEEHNHIKTPNSNNTITKHKDEEDDEEEDNMDVELAKFPTAGDPHKMAKMQAILSQFTEEQMSRYESFRRAGFQKANMKRLLTSITGTQKISIPITIAVSGIAKVFVGEVVETARTIMKERKETGPIRPCHLREAHRRLKLEGKIFKRTTSRLFR